MKKYKVTVKYAYLYELEVEASSKTNAVEEALSTFYSSDRSQFYKSEKVVEVEPEELEKSSNSPKKPTKETIDPRDLS